ncbi:MAG: arsenical pump-driving ATPase GET3 [Nitrospirota bacterium]|nr:arsenical pump-driving ATPase GET3 [Nitrospirota bacterium]
MNLKEIFFKNPNMKYIMFGGKGGLGKTTFSAATAFWLAKNGHKVLVFSVDPQASLSDIFQRDIFGKGAQEIIPGLFAQEIDADKRIHEYQNEIRKKILDRYGFEKIPEEIESYIAATSAEPAMEESAIFDAVVDIVNTADFDYYIYDLVPLGHALYYLSMSSIYDEWINKITSLREDMRKYEEVVAKMKSEELKEEDEILQELQYIRKRINLASSVFTDKERTGFFFVLTPEEMSIIDTEKAAVLFSRYGVPLTGYVANRVIPQELEKQNIPQYLKNRIESQKQPIEDIRKKFGDKVLGWIPELERDVTGLEMIEKIAKIMYEG